VNGFRCGTSGRVQPARFICLASIGAISNRRRWNKKENTMLRKLAAALIATTMIAAPAFAQNYDNAKPTAPAAQSQPAPAASTAPAKTTKTVKHTKKQKHSARGNAAMHQARHGKPAKSHQASVAKTVSKSTTTAAKHS
jgi:hypothetical protein